MQSRKRRILAGLMGLGMGLANGVAGAQVPANIEAELRKQGHIVDVSCVAVLYRPLMPKNDINSNVPAPLYPGVQITRNASFGPDPKDAVDIFTGDKGPKSRTVLIYVPGGSGNKIEIQTRDANAFYDNLGRWAVKNNMVAVTMQRHPGKAWNDGAKDVAAMIQWVQANIAKYHGNPDRMFIWAHSAGNGPLGIYIGHPELYGPKGAGVKGAIFMSGQFSILPVKPATIAGQPGLFEGAGKTCNGPLPTSEEGALPGAAVGTPGGPSPAPVSFTPEKVDDATALARSNLEGFKKSNVRIMLASAELDPQVDGAVSPFNQSLHDELCKLGPAHCPTLLYLKDQSHVSEVFGIGTSDTIVTGPILKWIKGTP